jgi:DNA-binding PadR family transcriptional regulator
MFFGIMSHRHLILGLLMEQPMSGYDIKKYVQTALRAVTNASYGTLYPALHKLLSEGAVEVQEIPQENRPAKKIYQITAQGRQELLTWLEQPPLDDRVRREFLLKLYLAGHHMPDQVLNLISTRRGQTEAVLRSLNSERLTISDPEQGWLLNYAITMCRAELDWLDQIEQQLDINS